MKTLENMEHGEMEADTVKVEYAKEVKEKIEGRNISPKEVEEVIKHGESTKLKLYAPAENRYLSKKIIKEATVYVEYTPRAEDVYVARTAYSHKSKLKEGG